VLTLAARRRFFAELRAREFPRLDSQELAYLDYTGAALASETQMRAHDALLRGRLLGDPQASRDS
jgi:hypothetical protein